MEVVKNRSVGSFFRRKYDNFLNKEIGHNISNTINYGGKALLSPVMIMAAAPFTEEKRETVWYSAIINPIQAGFALLTSVTASFAANNAIDHYAKKGTLFSSLEPKLGDFFNPAKEYGKQNLGKLKNISTIGLTLLTIPVTGLALNWLLPKIIKDPSENQQKETFKNTVYAGKIYA